MPSFQQCVCCFCVVLVRLAFRSSFGTVLVL
jgi:hypothetical protein